MLYHKEKELLEFTDRFAAGDEAVFDQIIQLVYPDIVNIAYRYLGSVEDAKDVSQEVCLKLYNNLGSFHHKAKLSTWMYRIAVNACIDFLRKRKPTVPLKEAITRSDEKSSSEVAEDIDRQDIMLKVQRKLAGFPLKQKNVIILKHFEGLTIGQISKILSCSESSVKTHLCRAVERLKKELGGEK